MRMITFFTILFASLYFAQFLFLYDEKETGTDLYLPQDPKTKLRYNCYYSILWCGCYSKTTSEITGCQVSCSPSYSHTLYNTTSCPHYKQYFLSGFQVST